jgi:protein required for attachment to host cells
MENSEVNVPVLIVVVDQRRARLVACKRLPNGRVRVDLLSTFVEQWNERAHDNPPSRTDSAGHAFDNRGHIPEERLHRFAREVTQWLGRELPKHPAERVVLFAQPQLLGALRSEASAALRKSWTEHAVDLSNLSEGELAHRPEVAALVPVLES